MPEHTHTSTKPAKSLKPSHGLLLSPVQLAWITEIGINPRFLRPYIKQTTKPVIPVKPNLKSAVSIKPKLQSPQPAASVQVQTIPQVNLNSFENISGLQKHAQSCQACELHKQRDNVVFGMGVTNNPDWFIVGEAPNRSDDRSGLPFQGEAGQLLQAMLLSIGLHPHNVQLGNGNQLMVQWSKPASAYYTNLIKCQPLIKRKPMPENIIQCLPYLQAQLDLIKPGRILALGAMAAQALLQVNTPLDDLRGKVHYINTGSGLRIPLIATWHPASLLVHPQNKPLAWADLQIANSL